MTTARDRSQIAMTAMQQYEMISASWLAEQHDWTEEEARAAINSARLTLARRGYKCSYATAANEYTVAVDGDSFERVHSYLAVLQNNNTRRVNAATVMTPSVRNGESTIERAVARWSKGDGLHARGNAQQLMALREAVAANEPKTKAPAKKRSNASR